MNDKALLRAVARYVRDTLIQSDVASQFRIRRRLSPHSTDTDGWSLDVAGLRGWNCILQVWLDRYPGYPNRKFYYGFCSNQKSDIKRVERRVRHALGEPMRVSYKDIAEGRAGTLRLAKRLAKSEFGRPLLEIYQTTQKSWPNYYGIYETDGTGLNRNRERRLMERITEFARTVVGSLPNTKKRDAIEIAYPRIENRRLVTQHLSRERSGHLAAIRKQADDYICQVCGFDFRKAYGTLGKDFAEAHHKEPLASSRRVRMSTVDDLVTVCSNCHRILHRMKGVPKDVDELKSLARRHKS